jgi:hypothetical protein
VGARALLTDGQEAQRTIGTRLTFQSPFEVEFEQASEAVMLIWAARRLCWINTLDFLQSLLSISKYRGGRIRGVGDPCANQSIEYNIQLHSRSPMHGFRGYYEVSSTFASVSTYN